MSRASTHPPWLDGDAGRHAPELPPPTIRAVAYDVLVVGAGLVGCTVALEAVRRGLSVAVIEASGNAALGVTGQATAKVTCGQGLRATAIAALQGDAAAHEYLRACADGLAFVGRHVGEATVADHDVYASDARDVLALERAACLAREAGIEVQPLADPVVPGPALAAVRYPGALLIDPVAYVRGLLAEAAALGVDIGFEVALRGLDAGDPHLVHTTHGSIQAQHVVLATHVPVLNRTLAFAKLVQRRHFAVAGEVDGPVPTSYDVSGRSFSTRPLAPGRAVVVGSAVTTGQVPGTESMHAVLTWAETHLGLRLTHTWSSQDAHAADELPLVGGVLGTPRLWIATGFAGWGFTAGTAAGLDLARRLVGEDARAPSWKPERLGMLRAIGTIAGVAARTAAGILTDAVALPERDLLEAAAELSPGQGVVVREGATPHAVSVDRDGTVRIVQGRCTHLGCVVRWDAESASWACPCHGSRFAPDGRVLHGPATRALPAFGESNVQHDDRPTTRGR